MTQINKREWMVATMARRANGETAQCASENAFRDLTGEEFSAYQAASRAALKDAAAVARAIHCERAATQRAA